jgi:hypothetical protein
MTGDTPLIYTGCMNSPSIDLVRCDTCGRSYAVRLTESLWPAYYSHCLRVGHDA